MEFAPLLRLIVQVLESWETIAVTIAIVLYLSLVFYVARIYRKPRKVRPPKKVKVKPQAPASEPETDVGEGGE